MEFSKKNTAELDLKYLASLFFVIFQLLVPPKKTTFFVSFSFVYPELYSQLLLQKTEMVPNTTIVFLFSPVANI